MSFKISLFDLLRRVGSKSSLVFVLLVSSILWLLLKESPF